MKDEYYIEENLNEVLGDIEIEYFESIKSTNGHALKKDFAHKYYLCYAEAQEEGRAQRGKYWVSEDSDNIYATLGFRCNFNVNENISSNIKVAVGVLNAIKAYVSPNLIRHLKIKLPNDIYYKNEKLAGILIETKNIKENSFDIIIGVGINVNMLESEEDIDSLWTSLAIINNQEIGSSSLLIDMVINIVRYFNKSTDIILQDFAKYDYIYNQQVTFNYNNEVYEGIARGVSNSFKLILELETKEEVEIDLVNINKLRIAEEY